MAKFDYNATLNTSIELITEFGNTVTRTRSYDESLWTKAYDPSTDSFTWTNIETDTPQSTEPDDEVTTFQGVLVGIEDSLLSNSLIKLGDSMLLAVETDEPKVGDVFTVNSRNYNYITHETINPAGTVCLYKIVLRI
jgi:hypothetical protein